MSSRLDRLFLLLDTASSPLTRKAAALQLGEVQKLHPHELHNLLAKVRKYLYSNTWETRVAAGQAVEAIISNVSVWDPPSSSNANEKDASSSNVACSGRMKLSEFDINRVIQNGTNTLLASEGMEFHDSCSEATLKDKLAKQRQLLNAQLGLSCGVPLGTEADSLVSSEDFNLHSISASYVPQDNKRNLLDAYQAEITQLSGGVSLSNRGSTEKKKRSKCFSTQTSKENDFSFESDTMPPLKKRCVSSVSVDYYSPSDSGFSDIGSDSGNLWEEPKEWPFESFCDELVQDLFHSAWVVRHGSATALREIIKLHGKGAGKIADTPLEQLELLNQSWLEDMSLRLTCVLALDKFGDFISDQVVAPVRETCAQALGATINIMSPASVEAILRILLQLLQRPEWEARHGGLLGLKYCLAVRKDMQRTMIPIVFDAVCKGLQDSVDDVSAVAASALVPVTNIIVSVLPLKLSSIITSLWDALLDLDDLTASTSSILELLASLLSFVDSSQAVLVPLDQLVPRLWPFLGHNSSGVRKSVLQTIVTLTSSKSPQACDIWVPKIMPTALRLLYQRVLIESYSEIHDLLFNVWKNMLNCSPLEIIVSSTFPFLGYWLSMLMQQSNVPIDPSTNPVWLNIHCKPKEKHITRNRKSSSSESNEKEIQEYFFIGGNEGLNETSKKREISVTRAKTMASKFLGILCSLITKCSFLSGISPDEEKPIDAFEKILLFHLNNKSAQQRFAISLVLSQWAENDENNCCPLSIKERCLECLNETIYYDEIALTFTKVQQECKDFIAFLKHYKFTLDPLYISGSVFTFEQISHLLTDVFPSIKGTVKLKSKEAENLEEKRKLLLQNVSQSSHDQMALTTMVQATIAGALVSLKYLPEKLNPVIRPLMESIKHEENEFLQKISAFHLVHLMELCLDRTSCPNAKILKNVTNFLCVNKVLDQNSSIQNNSINEKCENPEEKIISLINMQKFVEKIGLRRCNSTAKKISDGGLDDVANFENEIRLRKRGAKFVLTEAVQHFGKGLPEKLPTLWETIFNPLSVNVNPDAKDVPNVGNEDFIQNLICCLSVMEVVAPFFHSSLHSELKDKLLHVSACLENSNATVRHMAARCLGVLSRVITFEAMDVVFNKVLKRLGATDNDIQRQGAVEAIHCIIEELGLYIVPYIVLLIVPLLGRMSDQNEDVRLLATHCFAALIKLMPLEGGIKDPPNLHPSLIDRKIKERHFLEQLMNPKKLEPYKIPVCINAELRSYQQEGVNWLAFLNRYKLHGILCDDMGLGKTLQSICILAGDHELREKQFHDTKAADCKPLPSLVVCPPTLTGHWVYEVEKFVKRNFLKPLHYTGPPTERLRLRSRAKKHNLIIASYDIVRNDIDFFGSIHWNYCILDEGHIIKNGKTKLSKAIKQLSANHRLILSGTPIQNNVLELWSLFDFLIPGFLGTEKQFTARYSKPILLSRDAKASSKEQEAGVLAMESLHRQVLPFLLRRMKEDVLQDLPPKIIQDYYCELSALQVQLYEDFAKSRVKQSVEDSLCSEESSGSNQGASHVFQALQYLRKVCNHPKLVLTAKHPEFENVTAQLKKQKSDLQDVQHASKLCALKQLLQDCGIGTLPSGTSTIQNEPAPVVNQHRALIFCQLKSMLDILEKDLFQSLMPTVSYLRLDGSIPPGNRHAVVQRFNSDPSLDVLLLTTLVGGLGLNLTGADTVIFVEHDWNPMKDLQAMDRAHRIGQKKVVNVYRLITRGTLEEKIMGLQKFKLSIANSVINQENSSLQNMGTDQLLDLFSLDNKGQKITAKSETLTQNEGKGIKSVLENLPELWDTDQYETEYDLDNFLQSMQIAK